MRRPAKKKTIKLKILKASAGDFVMVRFTRACGSFVKGQEAPRPLEEVIEILKSQKSDKDPLIELV
jgi:hypothetical protein